MIGPKHPSMLYLGPSSVDKEPAYSKVLQHACASVVRSRSCYGAQAGAPQSSQQRAMTVILTSLVCPQVPPLRVRPADVADMAVYFSRQLSRRSAVRQMGLTSGAVRQLESYDFPNNIQVLPLCRPAHLCRSWAPCGLQQG